MIYDNNINKKNNILFKKFNFIKVSKIITIVKKRYLLNNIIKYREPREYIIIIIKIAKVVKLENVYN